MKFTADDINNTEPIRDRVEENSRLISEVVAEIIKPYCSELDKYIEFIRSILNSGNDIPTDAELDDFCLNLSTNLYFASGESEYLGVRDDMSKALWKDAYNSIRDSQTTGTVADKNTQAELASQEEQLTNLIYSRAYKVMKAKVESAQELLASCKKILSHRMQQAELSNMNIHDNNN